MTRKQKKNLIRIIISLAIFIAGLIVNKVVEDKIPWWGYLIIFVVPYIIVGIDVLISAFKNIIHGQFLDEKFLMMIASIGAFVIQEYIEAVAVMIFYQVGELLQSIAVSKSRKSIKSLIKIRPNEATILKDGEEIVVDPTEVNVGDIIMIKPGERVPVDCYIIEGKTTLDQSALTGESLPVEKDINDTLLSGSININGVVKAKVTNSFADSTVSKVLELIENATEKKAKSEQFITKFAKFYTPIVVFLALVVAIIPPLCLGMSNIDIWKDWIYRSLMFLVVSCPCALVISVPLSFFAGIGSASKNGILVKGSNYIELLSKVDTFVFDKTGTLTKGVFEVTKIHSINEENVPNEELLYLASLVEIHSNHPIAESIVKTCKRKVDSKLATDIEEVAGKGLKAKINEDIIFVGNDKLLKDNSIEIEESLITIGTKINVAKNNTYLGYILISDVIKEEAKETINYINNNENNQVVMLTGDRNEVASCVAEELNIKEYHSDLLPANKMEIVEDLINNGRKVAFVGDGVNDAPVIARADVGISMGKIGQDIAIEASDVVIMDDNISKIKKAISIAKKTLRIVYENISFSILIKVLVLILSVFKITNMWLAVFADVGVCLIAILNALRAMRISKK